MACTGLAAAALLVVGTGCGDDDGSDEPEPLGDDGDAPGDDGAAVGDPELRRELLDMQEADQADRTGAPVEEWDDDARTARLAEMIEEHGWPTRSLVGDGGASAAWLIAQHSDLDVEFQERALELMRQAVDDGEADPTELAYLEDRVALNQGRPQTYGTQIACVDGRAEPAELVDPDRVEELRAEVGLQPMEDYLAELASTCEAEAEQTG